MIGVTEARKIVRDYLDKLEADTGEELEVVDAETIERSFGWVFVYDSKAYLKTREFSDRLAGNAPLIVDRDTGKLHVTGTAKPVEHYIAEHEAAKVRRR
jgi:hypothetical protein